MQTLYLYIQLVVFTIDRAKWVIQWRFALFETYREPYISAWQWTETASAFPASISCGRLLLS